MKINYLKINGFGKIKNKEINLNKNINLIYGENESGKSTLLKFIYCMFYGASKNKNGKLISDFEKYKPWNGEEFSGKIKYTLDNKEEYEVYREFSKKNPKIFNQNLEDVSKQYNIDKNKGNQFFYEQTKMDELLFQNTNLVEQQNVVLDSSNQNVLTQKITNLLSSGEDNISYKKVMENLSKKLIQEVGTERTSDRPLNQVLDKIKKTEEEKEELNNISNIYDELKVQKKEIKNNILNIENEINLINDIKNYKEKEKIEREKININNNIKKEYTEKIIELKNKNKLNKENKKIDNKKINIINLVIISLLIILNLIINFINLPEIINNIIIISTIIYLIFYFIFYLNNKIKNKKINNKNNLEKIKIEKEIEILQNNLKYKENEISKEQELLKNQYKSNLENLKNKYNSKINDEEIEKLFSKNLEQINSEYEQLNDIYNNKKIELNTIEIQEKNTTNKLEQKLKCEEELVYLTEQKEELLNLEKNINMAKNAIEEAYKEMKNNITPKFTEELSKLIEKITNGKYKKAKFDNEEGLTIERENGEYINCNKLSIGTNDQMYLSLRLSASNEISEEKMPIFLDEAFAYYDDDRLKNILSYINEYYKENQVIIFTCSNREKEILDELNIEYNFITI